MVVLMIVYLGIASKVARNVTRIFVFCVRCNMPIRSRGDFPEKYIELPRASCSMRQKHKQLTVDIGHTTNDRKYVGLCVNIRVYIQDLDYEYTFNFPFKL